MRVWTNTNLINFDLWPLILITPFMACDSSTQCPSHQCQHFLQNYSLNVQVSIPGEVKCADEQTFYQILPLTLLPLTSSLTTPVINVVLCATLCFINVTICVFFYNLSFHGEIRIWTSKFDLWPLSVTSPFEVTKCFCTIILYFVILLWS